ncbi:UDP-N-acetylmuramoyl-tripeptide--D-alanyl-D-alanine ligase [Candidatus Defluviicoccus seviourii]|uniref:UDP-N-acetylmuramoyl-tripeptide--D-alanyl-D-alanine ligase n=1 Tax=Candidatus Defluviicoccus seviourii TaxID=2565273 RepID=A0A564WEK8_9PROT|nr:UDP-N-acetylmuramoyl-tripeptide--D-alanyl-D-alanine ligase [Candidatus Defluviicoccus seviourii]
MSAAPALWTAAEVLAATGGRAQGAAWQATGVSIDTRTLVAGDLFVALRGPNFDGADYAGRALAQGAAAALIERVPDGLADEACLVVVADTLDGLHALARAARERTCARVIAVTGSVGKTGVKEALRHVLAEQGATSASAGNLNNHWGLPLSLARLPRSSAFAVLEMGMNHAGEIEPLSLLARPHVAVITAIAPAHRGNFPSLAAIADAKAEIFAGVEAGGVEAGGVAVLNHDTPFYDRLAAAARERRLEVLSFGRNASAEVHLVSAETDAAGSTVRASVAGRDVAYRINLAGRHWIDNSLCVLAAVKAAGADVDAAARALASAAPVTGRGGRIELDRPDGRLIVIDDSYNASPASMAAAFDVLGRTVPEAGGRRIAVLGDMLELGEESGHLHAALADPLLENHADLVFACGVAMEHLVAALPAGRCGAHAPDSEALSPLVCAAVKPGDVVLVKGSAGSRMGAVVKALRGCGSGGGEVGEHGSKRDRSEV